MKREDFEHVVCAAAAIVDDDIVVIGSQAVLGRHPDAPESLLTSLEVDVYPLTDPGRAELIDGAIGDGSPFHETYGYYAHGVGPETARAPAGWESRLVSGRCCAPVLSIPSSCDWAPSSCPQAIADVF